MLINPLDDLAAISSAERPDDLWRWLVGAHTLRTQTGTFLAEVAFKRLHRDDTEDAWRTAVVRISAVDTDGQVHFAILPGSVAKNRHLIGRVVA